MGPTSAVVPTSQAWRAGSAASQRAKLPRTRAAAAGSAKAVRLGRNRAADSPLNTKVRPVTGITGCSVGTGTGSTGSPVRIERPCTGTGMTSTRAPAAKVTAIQIAVMSVRHLADGSTCGGEV
jgi:hypothetical protein